MLNIALLLGASLFILGIARYNKSNNLFWQLIIAFLLGFAAGHMGSTASSVEKKSTKEVSSVPVTSMLTISAMDDLTGNIHNEMIILPKKSKKTSYRDIVLDPYTSSDTYNPDDDIGVKKKPYDTS